MKRTDIYRQILAQCKHNGGSLPIETARQLFAEKFNLELVLASMTQSGLLQETAPGLYQAAGKTKSKPAEVAGQKELFT